MRSTVLGMLAVVVASATVAAEEKPIPEAMTPSGQIRLVAHDIATRIKDPTQAPFYQWISFIARPGDKEPYDIQTFRRVFKYILNKTNGSRGAVNEFEIPGSDGYLIRIDIRNAANWTRAGWEVVGNRDYLFREPWIPHRETEFIRLACGVKQDPKTLAAVKVVNGFQLFRDLTETNRQDPKGVNSTYYDLLYAAERHPDGELAFEVIPKPVATPEPKEPVGIPWPGGVWKDDGKFYPAGAFTWVKAEEKAAYEKDLAAWKAARADSTVLPRVGVAGGKGIKNFPATGADFEKRWGAEVKADDLKKFLIDPRFGGIAVGGENNAKGGSYVALNDRAIRLKKTDFGWAARTFDVFENTGDRDHLERVLEIAQGKIAFDAGELLATLPNGAQAAMLVNGQDERVEVAASTAAQVSKPKIDKLADVRTAGSCWVCHGASNGFIPFSEALQESIRNGLAAKPNDEKLGTQVRDFYTEWEKQIRSLQEPYQFYVEAMTSTKAEPKGWTSPTAVKEFQKARDAYDLPVTLDVAAREFGMTGKDLGKLLLDLSQGQGPLRESIKTRVNQLATGRQPIPRRTWEVDVAQQIGFILSATVLKEEPIKELMSAELWADAYKRFGKAVQK